MSKKPVSLAELSTEASTASATGFNLSSDFLSVLCQPHNASSWETLLWRKARDGYESAGRGELVLCIDANSANAYIAAGGKQTTVSDAKTAAATAAPAEALVKSAAYLSAEQLVTAGVRDSANNSLELCARYEPDKSFVLTVVVVPVANAATAASAAKSGGGSSGGAAAASTESFVASVLVSPELPLDTKAKAKTTATAKAAVASSAASPSDAKAVPAVASGSTTSSAAAPADDEAKAKDVSATTTAAASSSSSSSSATATGAGGAAKTNADGSTSIPRAPPPAQYVVVPIEFTALPAGKTGRKAWAAAVKDTFAELGLSLSHKHTPELYTRLFDGFVERGEAMIDVIAWSPGASQLTDRPLFSIVAPTKQSCPQLFA